LIKTAYNTQTLIDYPEITSGIEQALEKKGGKLYYISGKS